MVHLRSVGCMTQRRNKVYCAPELD